MKHAQQHKILAIKATGPNKAYVRAVQTPRQRLVLISSEGLARGRQRHCQYLAVINQ